jgi:tRNA(Ile)-lysidine synthase
LVEKKFLKAIKEFDLLSPKDKVLIAFSGGVDSSVLTYLLVKFKNYLNISKIVLAHLNHQLRGKDADLDESFAVEFGKKLDIPVFTKKVNIKQLSKERRKSIEEVAREERYRFFKEVLKRENLNKIATGHHLSDLAETMLLWFIQGNKRGIKGFKPKEKNIIRPLFLLKKEEIESYAQEKNIEFRIDKTNLKTDFLRNKVRLLVIPEIKKINPSFEDSLFYMSFFLNWDEEFLNKVMSEVSQNFQEDKLKLEILKQLPEAVLYRVLYNWIYEKTGISISYRQLYSLVNIIKKSEGFKVFNLKGKYILTKNYKTVEIKRYNKSDKKDYIYKIKVGEEVIIPEAGIKIISFQADEKFFRENIFNDKNLVCFDIPEEGSFEIRNRRTGDRFLPFGRRSEKKLKDVMIDLKIPKDMRDTIPLLVYRDKILWIVGYKRSGYFPVKENSKNIICFKAEEV